MGFITGIWIGFLLFMTFSSLLTLPISMIRIKKYPFFFPGWYFSLMAIPSLVFSLFMVFRFMFKTINEDFTFLPAVILYILLSIFFFFLIYLRYNHEILYSHTKGSFSNIVSDILCGDSIPFSVIKPKAIEELLNLGTLITVFEGDIGTITVYEPPFFKVSSIKFNKVSKTLRNNIKQDILEKIPQSSKISIFSRIKFLFGSLIYAILTFSIILFSLGLMVQLSQQIT